MRILVRATTVAACVSALVPAAAAAQSSCPNTSETSAVAARPAILCLVNAERRSKGLPALREHGNLRAAARSYAKRMVRQDFFSHDRPGLVRRIRHAGFLRHTRHWAIGENLAWGEDASGTPDAVVDAWMASPPHRRNILSRRFRRIGIGIVHGAPVAGSSGMTYVTDFGARGR